MEDLNTFLDQTVDAKIITVDTDKKRLVLSVKEVEKEKSKAGASGKNGPHPDRRYYGRKVETITGSGAFIDLGDGISGLVHISPDQPEAYSVCP